MRKEALNAMLVSIVISAKGAKARPPFNVHTYIHTYIYIEMDVCSKCRARRGGGVW